MKKKRKKRRKNRSNPESVALEGAKTQLTVENEAPVLGGEAANGEAGQEVAELHAAGEKAVAPEASDGKATEPEAAAGDAEDLEAATLEVVEPEPADPEAVVAEDAYPEPLDEVAGELEAAVERAVEPEDSERKSADRRQHARFVVGGRTKGRVTAIYDARILDISPGGSLIEHAHVVRPGTLSSLDLDLLGKRMSLRCRVARSVVHRSEEQPDGDRELIYRTGLEFLDRSDETRRMIIDYIQSMIEHGNKS